MITYKIGHIPNCVKSNEHTYGFALSGGKIDNEHINSPVHNIGATVADVICRGIIAGVMYNKIMARISISGFKW